MMQPATMWSSKNRSKMVLTVRQYKQLILIIVSIVMPTITMAAAQNLALSSTTPKLVHGALAAAATSNSPSNCSNVKHLFESQGINGADIPTQPITGKFKASQFVSAIFNKNAPIFSYYISISTHERQFQKFYYVPCKYACTFSYLNPMKLNASSVSRSFARPSDRQTVYPTKHPSIRSFIRIFFVTHLLHVSCVHIFRGHPNANEIRMRAISNVILSSFNVNIK